MRQLLILSAVLIFSIGNYAQETIVGKWNLGKHNAIVEIYKTDKGWEGKVISSDKDKIEKGKIMLKEIVKKDDYWKGKLYVPPIGSWLKATLKPKGEIMEVTASNWLMKKTKEWKKVRE